MQFPTKKRRLATSTKIAISAVVIIAAVFGGWRLYSEQRIKDYQLTEIIPGRVNLVAVRPAAGWRIIVSNSMAQLAEVSGMDRENDEDVQNGKRLPMREFVDSLRGSGDSLGYLIEKLGDIPDESIPSEAPRWKVADIEKAINGDAELKKRLEFDLQCRLDGTPVSELNLSALVNGIVIEVPVTVTIKVDGKVQEVVGIARSPYMSKLADRVSREVGKKFNPSDEYVMGVYVQEGLEVMDGAEAKEDVAAALRARYSASRVRSLAEKPQFLLDNSTVLINDSYLESASINTYRAGDKEKADMTLWLTEEGKMRMWKYSHENPGFQLLLIVDGLAYAAPRIEQTIAERQVQITQMPEPELAQDAANRINELVKERQ